MMIIEHDLPLVTAMSDRLIAMESGEVVVSGRPQDVRADPRVLNSYLAASDDIVRRSGRLGRLSALLEASESPTPDRKA